MKYEKGQMAELSWVDGNGIARWCYMVAVRFFDDRTQFIKEDGGRYMEFFSGDESEHEQVASEEMSKIISVPLYQNGKPVFSKRSLFGLGRYTFEPTTKGGK